jgi:hypothetical protein
MTPFFSFERGAKMCLGEEAPTAAPTIEILREILGSRASDVTSMAVGKIPETHRRKKGLRLPYMRCESNMALSPSFLVSIFIWNLYLKC